MYFFQLDMIIVSISGGTILMLGVGSHPPSIFFFLSKNICNFYKSSLLASQISSLSLLNPKSQD